LLLLQVLELGVCGAPLLKLKGAKMLAGDCHRDCDCHNELKGAKMLTGDCHRDCD
jgi:hypothetical protein